MKKFIVVLMLLLAVFSFNACSHDETKANTKDETQQSESVNATEDEDSTDIEGSNDSNDNDDKDDSDAIEDIEVGAYQGQRAIDFELSAFNFEESFKLSDYLGKNPIIIKFFASWCGPCRMEMPALNEVYEAYRNEGLKVFAVNLGNGDSPDDVKQLIDDYLLTYPVLIDENSLTAANYYVRSIPVNIFIGKDGIIKYHEVGMKTKEDYEEKVKELLAE